MPKISLKKDFTDGSILYGKDLNPNFELLETVINENTSVLPSDIEEMNSKIDKTNEDLDALKDDLQTNYSSTNDVDAKISLSASNTLASSKNYTNEQLQGYATKGEIPTKISQLSNDDNTVKDAEYVHTDNNYTNEDKSKLGTLKNYELPIATADVLGGIKLGEGLQAGTDGKVNVIGGGGSGTPGENGATFTPSVSEEGVISWTNDKSLPNPDPVNIKGPAGKDGESGPKGDPGVGIPIGGTVGQILSKFSNDDYDTTWIDAPSGDSSLEGFHVLKPTAEEPIDLAALDEEGIYYCIGSKTSSTDYFTNKLNNSAGYGNFVVLLFQGGQDDNTNYLLRVDINSNGYTQLKVSIGYNDKSKHTSKLTTSFVLPQQDSISLDSSVFLASSKAVNTVAKAVGISGSNMVPLSNLQTNDKSSLVNAINELKAEIDALKGSAS